MTDLTSRIFGSRGLPPEIEEEEEPTKIVYRDREVKVYPEDVLTPYTDGKFTFRRCVLSPTNLEMPDDISEDEFKEIGGVLLKLEQSLGWHLGDWANRGDAREWGKTYAKLAADCDYEIETLYTYRWLASRVQSSIRNRELSLGHHRLVATLDSEKQKQWLAKAAAERWSIKTMKEKMREEKQGNAGSEIPNLQLVARRVEKKLLEVKQIIDSVDVDARMEIIQALGDWIDSLKQSD